MPDEKNVAQVVRETSTVTSKGQTTIPKSVRQALGIESGDSIAYLVENRHVTLERVTAEGDDPTLGRFLLFLTKDMDEHPERIAPVDADLINRVNELTKGMEVNPDDSIEGDVGL